MNILDPKTGPPRSRPMHRPRSQAGWLYYTPAGETIYRIKTADLTNES